MNHCAIFRDNYECNSEKGWDERIITPAIPEYMYCREPTPWDKRQCGYVNPTDKPLPPGTGIERLERVEEVHIDRDKSNDKTISTDGMTAADILRMINQSED